MEKDTRQHSGPTGECARCCEDGSGSLERVEEPGASGDCGQEARAFVGTRRRTGMTATTESPPRRRTGLATAVQWRPQVRVGDGVRFGSCFVYSPNGAGENARYSRSVCLRVKTSDVEWLPRYVGSVFDHCEAGQALVGFFSSETVLVPVPTYLRCTQRRAWGAACLASCLKEAGIPGTVWRGLHRIDAVPKSSTACGPKRPSVATHYESLGVARAPERVPERLLLIDDVVSSGRTLLACWMRLRERFPQTPIAAFALIRTLGFVREIPRLVVPCVGRITWTGVDARRYP
jgi:hypothetical protein